MSCSDYSVDSLESSEFLNSNDKVKHVKQKPTSNSKWKMSESLDLMSVPLYSGSISLQELKRIEVNGNKILKEPKEFSNITKKKLLSNSPDKSKLKYFEHPTNQRKNYSSRVFMKIEKIDQMKQSSTKSIVTTNK